MSTRHDNGILPADVKLCSQVERYLSQALHALERGLLISAWSWTEKARAALDEMTDGAPAEAAR